MRFNRGIFACFEVFNWLLALLPSLITGSFEEEIRLARGVRQPDCVAAVLRLV